MLRSENFGPQWDSLVSRWALFEKRERYDGALRLPAKHRPSQVSDWIQRARPVMWRPHIKDIADYEEACRLWWTSLQPAWRVLEGVLVLDAEDGEWEVLRRPGINGIMSFLTGLFYWRISIKEQGDKCDMWNFIVRDCNRAFIHLLS